MRQIIIDTNLLVLLVVGATQRNLINRHKRTNIFTQEDFDLLLLLLEQYEEVVITPSILTEACNLLAQIGEPDRSRIMQVLGNLTSTYTEVYTPSSDVAKSIHFVRLGLTDCSILELPKELPLITVDLDLYLAAAEAGYKANNFNHLRAEYLFPS
jgi:hypothetical protein